MAARNPFASSIPDIYDAYAPYSYQRKTLSTGYHVVRNLLIVGALCGGFVALYRNDVLRDLSRRVGMEPRYLAAEQFLVGTPGWGTPRSMEPVLAQDGSATAAAPLTTPLPEPAVAATPPTEAPAAAAAPIPPPTTEPASATTVAAAPTPVAAPPTPVAVAPTPVAPAPAPAPAPVAAAPIDPLAPVKFESLPLVGQQAPRAVSFNDLPSAHAAAAPARAPAPAPVAHAAPARPAPAPATRGNGKAIKVSLDETPAAHAATARSIPAPSRAAPPPEPKPEPKPVAAKPAPPPGPKATEARSSDNPLLAAVRGAVRTRPPKDAVPAAK
ncbi:MAG TPA: hypothetical protein VNN72_18915 [Polyangiaceae bacterium]|nr:hypothetical protein [Polyangiaceae bacterium]